MKMHPRPIKNYRDAVPSEHCSLKEKVRAEELGTTSESTKL